MIRASMDRYLYFANQRHRPLGYWRIPVTDAIPLEQVNSGESGEPSRVRGQVYVTGVDVRFTVNMAASTSVVGAMYNAGVRSDPVAISNGANGRPECFTMGAPSAVDENVGMLLSTNGVSMVTEDGPFAVMSGGHGISLDSPDGSLHLARIKTRGGGPVGKVFRQDFQLAGPPQLGCRRYEEKSVKAYFPVRKWFEYGSNDDGVLEFERPLEIVMGVKSKVIDDGSMTDSSGRIEAGNVTGVMVDVYWRKEL